MKTVVLLGALDTKGVELAYVREQLEKKGHRTLVVDNGVMGTPKTRANISRQKVASAGGKSLEALIEESRKSSDRAPIIEVMAEGAASVVRYLYSQGRLDGIFSLGGSMGTAMAMRAMHALPVGVPKLMVSTHLYPQAVGDGDVTIMISPTDIMGLNPIIQGTLARAAAALSAMLETPIPEKTRPLVGITALGVTTPGAILLQEALRTRGYDTVVFHGRGKTVDQFAADRVLDGVIDFTLSQLVRELLTSESGGKRGAGTGQSVLAGIPQVIVPGSVDMLVLRASPEQLPEKYRDRKIYRHGPFITAVRTTAEDLAKIATAISGLVNRSSVPIAVVIPRGGFSEIDKEGQSFFEPETDSIFSLELRKRLTNSASVVEFEYHINDGRFASEVARIYAELAASSAGA